MVNLNHFFTAESFKVLKLVGEVRESISFKEIKERLGLNSEENQEIYQAVGFLKHFGYPVSISYRSSESDPWLIFESQVQDIKLNLSLHEWLFLQKMMLEESEQEGMEEAKFLKGIITRENKKNKLASLESICLEEEKKKEHFSLDIEEKDHDLSQLLRKCVEKHISCVITMKEGHEFEIFPHRVVFLEGDLIIIGEDYNDRCLIHFPLADILSCEPRKELSYETNFSTIEVEDFIQAVRSINENEERLILKLKSPEKVDFNPDFLYLGNPYVTTNMDGDFIWAASVEVSYELFEWLDSIEGLIEVLDPQSIKEEYERYQETKQKVGENFIKKAS